MSRGIKWMVQGMALVFLVGLMASPAMADKFRDYERALGERSGCAKIPYSNLRDDCKDEQRQKSDCKNRNYEGTPIKKGCNPLRPDRNAGDEDYRDLIKEMWELRIKCHAARVAEQEAFAEAMKMVKNERDKKITQSMKDDMIKHLDSGTRTHAQAIREADTHIDKCKKKHELWKKEHDKWKRKNK